MDATRANGVSPTTNGHTRQMPSEIEQDVDTDLELDIYEILRAAWLTRVQRLEEFAARYIAYRLESFIDTTDFADLVKESAERITRREETDSIELLDDIRYYLSERFRLRFEDAGLEEVMDEEAAMAEAVANSNAAQDQNQVQMNGTRAHGAVDTSMSKAHSRVDEVIDMSPSTSAGTLASASTSSTTAPSTSESTCATSNPTTIQPSIEALLASGAVRTLDGELAGDEFAAMAVDYQILLGKIDSLLERLKLDA